MNARFPGVIACLASLHFAAPIFADEGDAKATKKTFAMGDGTKIVGEVSGKGDTALVFLHGWCGDHEYWKHQVKPFATDYQVVTMDLAGHGESSKDRKEWTVSSLADDVAAVVKELGLKRVVLVGHSMGGPVALMAAKKMPGVVVGVIGVDTLQNVEFKMPEEAVKGLLDRFEQDFKGTVGGGFVGGLLAEKSDEGLKKWLSERAAAQDQKMAIGLMADMSKLDQAKLLKEAGVPVRCINSAGGFQFHRPTQVETNKKHGDYNAVFIEEVGHYPMLEKPEEFNKALKKVLGEFAKKS
jgi:pimeloyl-ACP methyl ester carboxylesterase